MTTRIEHGGPPTDVVSTDIAPRQTPVPLRPFRQLVRAGADVVVEGAEAAVRRLPGGPIVAAAFRPGFSTAEGSTGAARPEGPSGTAGLSDSSAPGGGIETQLAENSDRTMYYLELQERISAESRAYTALSNVLKTRHDTIKNAIGNIR